MTSISRIAAQPTAAAAAAAEKPAARRGAKEPAFNEFLVLLDDQATREVEKGFDMPVGPKRREYVAKTLLDNMSKTQAPLWDVLDGLKNAGHVGDYTPLWIQNAIVVKGDETAEAVMSSAAGVAQAMRSAKVVLDRPSTEADHSFDGFEPGGSKGKAQKGDPQWNIARMGAQEAWDDGLTGKGLTVGILDTGVDVTHPALMANYRGYDAELGGLDHTANWHDSVEGEGHSDVPVDVGRHGTHVDGTIVGNYGPNKTGMAPGAMFTAARGLGEEGGTDGMLLRGFQTLVAPRVPTPGVSPGSRREFGLGVDVINNSWGSDDGNSTSYLNALRNMAAMGVINVFAAGNDGSGGRGTLGSPASSPYVISVAATDRKDKPANFSSTGPNPLPTPDGEPSPFIAAPGVDIRSTVPGGGFERGWQGTSMAAPAVTGLVLLAQQAAREEAGTLFDVRGMKDLLKRAAQDVGPKGVDDSTGYGIAVANPEGGLRKLVREVATERGMIKPAKAAKSAAADIEAAAAKPKRARTSTAKEA